MSYMPKNVRDYVKATEQRVAHSKQQAEASRIATIAKWSDQDLQRSTTRTGTLLGQMTLTSTQADRDAGVKSGIETVKAARQARLRELYERE